LVIKVGSFTDNHLIVIEHALADSNGVIQLVREGDLSPDSNGTFSSFTVPEGPNVHGQATFWAELNGTTGGSSDNTGIFLAGPKEVVQLARAGDPAPDGNGTFSSFSNPDSPNELGQITFWAELNGTTGGSSDNTGLFLADSKGIIQIIREGDPAPDGNGTFLGLTTFPPGLNNRGQVTFRSTITGTTGGEAEGIFLADSKGVVQLGRRGDLSPDGNGDFSNLSASDGPNQKGQSTFFVLLINTNGGDSDNTGIFLAD
jgi:hypothetical protein